jgi:hypothetical protein
MAMQEIIMEAKSITATNGAAVMMDFRLARDSVLYGLPRGGQLVANATDAHGEKRIHEISLEHPTHIQKMIHIRVQPLGAPAEPKRLQPTPIRD